MGTRFIKANMRVLFLAGCVASTQAAVDVEGARVVNPVSEKDPVPIADTLTYHPDQHDCPLICADLTNMHSWSPFYAVERLQRCAQPMLLRYSVTHALDDPATSILIRACTFGSQSMSGDRTTMAATSMQVKNPKKDEGLLEKPLAVAAACAIDGAAVSSGMALSTSNGASAGNGVHVARFLDGSGIREYFEAEDNCDENFLFAYHQGTVAGVYIGPGLGKPSVAAVLDAVAGALQIKSDLGNQTVAQVCDEKRSADRIFGIAVNTNGDLVEVQRAALKWSQGSCVPGGDLKTVESSLPVTLSDISAVPFSDGLTNGTSVTGSNSTAAGGNSTLAMSRRLHPNAHYRHRAVRRGGTLASRATCNYISVQPGDTCTTLAVKCGIRGSDFTKYNPKVDCSNVQATSVCCSAGDPYVPPTGGPAPNPDGSCASYVIQDGDTCSSLATRHGVTVEALESFNKGKTWAWTECKDMLLGYNMCLGPGVSPLPPEQQGTECGPLVPGTKQPGSSTSMTQLNPCPLKACCSNWGFCGPFAAHCDIHAPPNAGPGVKLKEFQSSCISNCGNEIKQNSGPPASFGRIGYYESWNMGRDCLWLKGENSNTDGTYSHMHWGFAEIDPNTWKVVLKDPHKQWAGFKKLSLKRIVSFGGWAYSTEPATFNIIRRAIIDNRETFATNVAKFVNDEGLDGVDIDWEYPGAPDIMVDGKPIGQTGDGVAYLRFLTTLKQKLPNKSISIAAPASYWYLKAFPIDRIAAVIDYIVYMTYDLHGQWDYGNVNAFDSCPSGKCIRSHVNLTETRNSLAIITKAGVPNNKIFVGESSYGRSFHMAVNGCYGPMCDFTGTRTTSDAKPGRCTATGGYISNAEIYELIKTGSASLSHDRSSNTDVLIYEGDYVSFMSDTTKDTRRVDWKNMNFAGTIDWAVDLQEFRSEDMNADPDLPGTGEEGCVMGIDRTINSGDLCEFSCNYGFCPETLCLCTGEGPQDPLPNEIPVNVIAWDSLDLDLNRLCKFACKYGYCPDDICTTPVIDQDEDGPIETYDPDSYYTAEARLANAENCIIYKSGEGNSAEQCYGYCKPILEEAAAEERISNYGCVGYFPGAEKIPWTRNPGDNKWYVGGKCSCDNYFMNWLAEAFIEALPVIAQIGCYIMMQSLKIFLDIGMSLIPGGAGRIAGAGYDMLATGAGLIAHTYPEGEDPAGAFEWWLSPCGDTSLVPEDVRKAFDMLSLVPLPRTPKTPKGSGRKGDAGNPTDQSKPKGGAGKGPNGTGNGVTKKKCNIPPNKSASRRSGRGTHTLIQQSCVNDKTQKNEMVITSIAYGNRKTVMGAECRASWGQACWHYSSVIRQNPAWATLPCPPSAATTVANPDRRAPDAWTREHNGGTATVINGKSSYHADWRQPADRKEAKCDLDEYPPAYLLDSNSPALINAGLNTQGQMARYLPQNENRGAGSMWKGKCFSPHVGALSNTQFVNALKNPIKQNVAKGQTLVAVSIDAAPVFTITAWPGNTPRDDGLWDNKCWPSGKAAGDPGFALFGHDQWYNGKAKPYDYKQRYAKGSNGS